MAGTIALVGGNEFRVGCEEMDREVMRASGRDPASVIIIPTAAVNRPGQGGQRRCHPLCRSRRRREPADGAGIQPRQRRRFRGAGHRRRRGVLHGRQPRPSACDSQGLCPAEFAHRGAGARSGAGRVIRRSDGYGFGDASPKRRRLDSRDWESLVASACCLTTRDATQRKHWRSCAKPPPRDWSTLESTPAPGSSEVPTIGGWPGSAR